MTLQDILSPNWARRSGLISGHRGANPRDRRHGVDRLWRRADHPPLSTLDIHPVSLDPTNLPLYALRTILRMLLAIVCSTVFTFIYAALAAKSRRAEMVLIPLLDILQSVPILGFLTFTVVFFLESVSGQRVRRRACARVRDLHQPGLEHDVQHVPVDAQRPDGSRRGVAKLPFERMAALLAARRAVRDAGPDLECDDVDVGRLVFRGGVGIDNGRQYSR